ncbi:hypothetical protein BC938DRAFT_477644 [Jimgerdemannia flammicorona]|uniref:Uncharacterized protein n=1 Tax=Jimgerdemannia flammicorona TaxID=994334 RepID=A0A433QP23_9FUNG|nr:hypothetical protein BC938DRAFT_477644 [Jimgerdemannia flammicorona]
MSEPLPDDIVGEDLGQFKVEYSGFDGYFVGNKMYVLQLSNGKMVRKANTVGENLPHEGYIDLYNVFDKRDKVFNEEGVWMDTKPLVVNEPLEVMSFMDNEVEQTSNGSEITSAIRAEFSTIQAEKDELREEVRSLNTTVSTIQAENDELREEVRSLNTTVSTLNTNLTDLNTNLTDLINKLLGGGGGPPSGGSSSAS